VQPNPYAAPQTEPVPVTRRARSAATFGTIALAAIGLQLVVRWLLAIVDLSALSAIEARREPRAWLLLEKPLLAVLKLLTLAAVVLFLVWMYRASRNVHARGRAGMTVSPWGAVAWFFVPLGNLFMPYVAMSGLSRASAPRSGAESRDGGFPPASVLVWWLLLVASYAVTLAVQYALRNEDAATRVHWDIAAIALATGSAVALLFVVRRVSRDQARWLGKRR
jgi:hypothetical protein